MPLIETSHYDVDLKPAPIEPAWIIEGNPQACNHVLFTSDDGTTQTIVWSCTAGSFDWYYDVDETILILEGSAIIEGKRYGPGDVILFRDGAQARWQVRGYVKKLAFFRQTNPSGPVDGPRRQQSQAQSSRSSGRHAVTLPLLIFNLKLIAIGFLALLYIGSEVEHAANSNEWWDGDLK